MLTALNKFNEAIFEKDIMTNDDKELIGIIAELKFADFSLCSCSDSFKNAHEDIVEKRTKLSIARSVLANARRRGESSAYINRAVAEYRQHEQPFLNARKKFLDLLGIEDERLKEETQKK
jgi:hypothetical protein